MDAAYLVLVIADMNFSEIQMYDSTRDMEMIRVFSFDGHGQEYWTLIPAREHGPSMRQLRSQARQSIEHAVQINRGPGEVKLGFFGENS